MNKGWQVPLDLWFTLYMHHSNKTLTAIASLWSSTLCHYSSTQFVQGTHTAITALWSKWDTRHTLPLSGLGTLGTHNVAVVEWTDHALIDCFLILLCTTYPFPCFFCVKHERRQDKSHFKWTIDWSLYQWHVESMQPDKDWFLAICPLAVSYQILE
jgi:hypothetical protein